MEDENAKVDISQGIGQMATSTSSVLKIAPPPRCVCSRHGESDAVMFARIYAPCSDLSPFTDREVILERRYCMHCYVEHLDKAGVQDMEPVRK